MIEMSAATVPALAQPGAILAAAPAPAGSEGTQIADFSAVLAGAALVAQIPEPTVAAESEPQNAAPIIPELVAPSAKPASKTSTIGKETGKMLPPGKLPVARHAATTAKAPRTNEIPEEPAPTQDAAPAEQVTVDAPLQTAPAAPTPIVIQQTATVLQERTISDDTPQTTAQGALARAANVVMRPAVPSRSTAAPKSDAEQTVEPTSLPPEAEIAAGMSPTNTSMPMASDTVAVSSHVTPQTSPRDRTAVVASAPSKAAAADATGTVTADTAVSQTVTVALPPSVTGSGPTAAPVPLVSTKAALVATTAANLMQPGVAQPSARAVRTDESPATLAHSAAHPDSATPATPASMPARTLAATSAPAPASTLATTPQMPVVSDQKDSAPQPATLAMAPASPVVASMATSTLQAAASAIIAPVLPPQGEIIRTKASDDLTIAAPDLSGSISDPGKPAIRVDAKVSAPVAPSTRDAAVVAASLPAQPSQQALTTSIAAAPTGAPLAAISPVPAPEVAPQQSATTAPAPIEPRAETAIVAQPALAAAEPIEHKRALPATATEAPTTISRPEPISLVTGNDMRTAAIFAAPAVPASATTPTQDIAALVDRITEARAAAAPNTIRAALVHEDFGSVSLNIRSEASHIHVTLGSADPGFAPAVQAAAAANLANNGSDDAQNRRDAPAPQTSQQPQDATRNDASSQQQQAQRDRASAGERQPSRQAPGRQSAAPGERASSAAEPRRRSGIFA